MLSLDVSVRSISVRHRAFMGTLLSFSAWSDVFLPIGWFADEVM